ncbi:MAG TPA: hypothetical protein VE465_22885 [Streptosporangiaceae bacterium]|nr:hypothetical protein [Streptosporangiaceae bacterium]
MAAALILAAAVESPEYAGALMVTSREALIAEFDAGANAEQLGQLAQRLDTALSNLGG